MTDQMRSKGQVQASRDHSLKVPWYTKVMNWYRGHGIVFPGMNAVIRNTLRRRLVSEKKVVEVYKAQHAEDLDKLRAGAQFFFGLSSIRTGTVYLSDLLNTGQESFHVEHEANVLDYWNYAEAYNDASHRLRYIKDFRLWETLMRMHMNGWVNYGEVNPFLKMHGQQLKEIFPNAKFFHLVRDGRDVVRSMMSREILDTKDPMKPFVRPDDSDPYAGQWPGMSRFERLCWQWKNENEAIADVTDHHIQLEKLKADYAYFNECINAFLGVDITEEHWANYQSPKNITPKYKISHWKEWNGRQRESFEKICGEQFTRLGYELNW